MMLGLSWPQLGGLVVLLFLIITTVIIRFNDQPRPSPGGNPRGGGQPGAPAPRPRGNAADRFGWDDVFWLLKGVTWVALLALLYIAGRHLWKQEVYRQDYEARVAELEAAKVQALETKQQEVWSFWHIDGDDGEKKYFEVEVTKNEGGRLHGTIQRKKYEELENVAGLKLVLRDGDYTGTWVSYLDDDRGSAKLLKQAEGIWSGEYRLQDDTTRLCGLTRTYKKKVR